MTSKIIGYVISVKTGCASIPGYMDDDGVVWAGYSGATLFATRSRARKAIRQTIKYSNAQGYSWRSDEYTVWPIRNMVK